jgi:hypothetical protein
MSNIDGIWDCIVVSPGGKEPHILTMQTQEDGTLTGTMANPKNGQVMELKDGRVTGQKLTWTMQLVKPFKLTLKIELDVDGNTLKGYGGAMLVGKAPITGTKRA